MLDGRAIAEHILSMIRGHWQCSVVVAATLCACVRDRSLEPRGVDANQSESRSGDPAAGDGPASITPNPFTLKPDWAGPCTQADPVDVNLGHVPETFVRAAHCQVSGQEPTAEVVRRWAERLNLQPHLRRVDLVRSLCLDHNRKCQLSYSDPWRAQPELLGAPKRAIKREVGAVFMFFFNCPGGVNCDMNWANTHALGMKTPHPLYGASPGAEGYHTPSEPGFWRRELLEVEYAGLSFLLVNAFGPDVRDEGKLAGLAKEITASRSTVKLALFDDTWAWGQRWFGDFWKQKPDLNNADVAARTLYEAKWKPFFSQIEPRHWYRFKGRPLIYFYNAGTLTPRDRSAAVLEKMKARFAAEFGETPFLAVDTAFFEDTKMPSVADAQFTWYTFNLPQQKSRSTLHGHIIDNAMVKWDAVGRDRPGQLATERDVIIKDSKLLERVLAESRDAELLILATWNDLGEGTGIHRNYDYFSGGVWREPDHFMRLIRASQSAPAP